MLIAVSSEREDLESRVDRLFGRCPCFLLVDTDTMTFRALPNPAQGASGGAGIAAAQFVVREGAKAVLTGNVGPNAMQVLSAAGIPVYTTGDRSVREAVDAFRQGQLQTLDSPTVANDFGKGGASASGPGFGLGRGMGGGRGMGRGGR